MAPTTKMMMPIVHKMAILATNPMMSRMIPRIINPVLPDAFCWLEDSARDALSSLTA